MVSIHKTSKQKILEEIEGFPEEKISKLYRIIRLLVIELRSETKKTGNRGSLKGLWKGNQINDSMLIEAKKTLFPYEYR